MHPQTISFFPSERPAIPDVDGLQLCPYPTELEYDVHLYVYAGDKELIVSLPDGRYRPEGYPEDPALTLKLQGWTTMTVTVEDRKTTVSQLLYAQWLRVRNGYWPETLPTPDQIRARDAEFVHKQNGIAAAAATDSAYGLLICDHYSDDHLVEARPLTARRLYCISENGDIRIADVEKCVDHTLPSRKHSVKISTVWRFPARMFVGTSMGKPGKSRRRIWGARERQ